MTLKRRLEFSFIFFILTSSVIIPLIRAELFPYSSFQLFTDAPQIYATYKVIGKSGKEISLRSIKLHRNYYGIIDRAPFARKKPYTNDKWGEVLSDEKITELIRRRAPKDEFPITAKVTVTGVKDGKVQTIKEHSFVVTND